MTIVAAVMAALAWWLAVGDGSLSRLRPGRPWSSWVLARGRRLRLNIGTRAQEERAQDIAAGVPVVCDLLAVCVEAGRPPRGALRVLASVSPEPTAGVLEGVVHQLDLGVDEATAWRSLGAQPGYRSVARDVARSISTGVALADLLRSHAREARAASETLARARARKVAVSGVIPLVACFLPAFLLVGVVPIFGGIVGHLFGG